VEQNDDCCIPADSGRYRYFTMLLLGLIASGNPVRRALAIDPVVLRRGE
jgi:hypothetical protein